jgi:hypothetical protein
MKEPWAVSMQSWAIYRYERKGRLKYLAVITAKDGKDAHKQAVQLMPEENPESLIAKPWTGEPEQGTF